MKNDKKQPAKETEVYEVKSSRRLVRPENDRVFAGVAAGLGEYFNIDSTIVRLIFLLITIFGGSGVLVYFILWLVMPPASKSTLSYEQAIKEGAVEMKVKAESFAEEFKENSPKLSSRSWVGVVLLVLGIIFLLENFGLMPHFRWDRWWPIFLIIIGLAVIVKKQD